MIGPKTFANTPNLTQLYLSGNQITPIDPAAFVGLKHLETLRLDSNRLVGVHPEALVPLKNLIELDLSTGICQGFHEVTFDALKNLKILWLNVNPLAMINPRVFQNFDHLGYIFFCYLNFSNFVFIHSTFNKTVDTIIKFLLHFL